MALRTFARCPDEIGGGLLGFGFRTSTVDQEGRKDKRKRDDASDEH